MNFSEFVNSDKAGQPHYLLIGSPIGHSVSPLIHNTALEYHNIPAAYYAVGVRGSEISTLIAHFNSPFFMGANVTIPYKETLFDSVDSYDEDAAQIGAINTIVKKENGVSGYNTDAYGFTQPIRNRLDEIEGTRVIIFGTGGATKAIIHALRNAGSEEIVLVSRRPGMYEMPQEEVIMAGYNDWMAYADEECSMIVNATPLGMEPNTQASPVDEKDISFLNGKICYDIVYNPQDTLFLDQAIRSGGIPVGGLEMLIHQAEKAFELWTGKEFPLELVRKKLNDVF
ncbi:shikimate dehydrogenase [Balneola sp. MJW-20]|uniref:shikimate dehydrogenase n=1 Tax=Gracilimonas aurantiaca TaxID=3234185 RepID=UPI0034667830